MIVGQIKKILTQKDNDWGRYQIECAGEDILAVGVIPGVSIGMTVTLEGSEVTNQYGKQFKISSVLATQADDLSGARRFLADGYIKGIGATKAEAILRAFGKDSVDLFDTEEGRKLLTTVKGISHATIIRAMPSYEQNKKYKDIVVFLNGCGTKNQVESIYKKYGSKSIKVLSDNPYRLQMDLTGFGFTKADSIALASGIKTDSIYRIMAGVKYIVEDSSSTSGHCYLPYEEIKAKVVNLLVPAPKCEDITEKVVENALANWPENKEKLIKAHDPMAETINKINQTAETRKLIIKSLPDAVNKAIEEEYLINENGCIYTRQMYETEVAAAKMIVSMCKKDPVRLVTGKTLETAIRSVEERKTALLKEEGNDTIFTATEEQIKAASLGVMNRLSIISGGPGRGKTAISEIVALAFLLAGNRYDPEDIIMLAPTGRAAQRITESTGYAAMTIHRAVLSVRNKADLPKGKLVLCDEFSMADIYLLLSVLKYAKDCNLVLVGDVDQIASVGPGKVLRDMIDCGKIPCILLKQGHRNSGTIAKNSELINAGMKINKYSYDEHFKYIPCTVDNIAENMVNDYLKKVNIYGIKNVMLCCAMRERGVVSVNKLNLRLQEIFTKGKEEAVFPDGRKFRVGDRVMQIKNDYGFVVLRNGEMSEGIFNGERGSIIRITYDEDMESYKITVMFDDGSLGGYTKNTIMNLTLAYATTLHKCQGSEAACMMMSYTFGDYILLNRSLFYTGETRAKKEFCFYGEEKYQYGKILSAFDIAVGKTDDAKRYTMLAQRIIENIN